MTGLLIGIGVLVFIALIVAGVNGTEDAIAQRELNQQIGAAAKSAANRLDLSLGNDLGATGITARTSGLTEFVHSLSSITETDRRSGLPALALLTAGLLAIGGGVAVVVDRVEDRREFEACVEGAAAVASAPPTTTSTVPEEPDAAATGESATTSRPPAEGSPEGTAAPVPDTAPNAPDAPIATPDLPEPTRVPATADASSFLTSCLNHMDGTLGFGDKPPESRKDGESEGAR